MEAFKIRSDKHVSVRFVKKRLKSSGSSVNDDHDNKWIVVYHALKSWVISFGC